MVTGFNTDVEHEGQTYHVQTEDKGFQNPIIETLIYMGGEVLAARRSSYADLLPEGVEDKEIAERIETQHNRMILDIREGKYDRKRPRPFGEGIISNRSFDEVVLEYLASQAAMAGITVEMIGSEGIVEGETARMNLLVSRPGSGAGLAGARVRVKIISTVMKPRMLADKETDRDGQVSLSFRLPVLERGTAALIVQATAGEELAEIKQPIGKPARKVAG